MLIEFILWNADKSISLHCQQGGQIHWKTELVRSKLKKQRIEAAICYITEQLLVHIVLTNLRRPNNI